MQFSYTCKGWAEKKLQNLYTKRKHFMQVIFNLNQCKHSKFSQTAFTCSKTTIETPDLIQGDRNSYKLPNSKTAILRWWEVMSHWLLSWCLWMEAKDVTKEFPSAFQYCQSQTDFINSLIEITVRNDMRELDVKTCSQLLTLETLKVMFIIHG